MGWSVCVVRTYCMYLHMYVENSVSLEFLDFS